MQSIPKDIDLYVHRLIYESCMRELIQEYHSLYESDVYNQLYLKWKGTAVANYRDVHPIENRLIFGCSHRYIGMIFKDGFGVYVPRRYFFSSGMDSLEGYK